MSNFLLKKGLEINKTLKQKVGTITGSSIDVSSGDFFSFTPTLNTTFTFDNPPASGKAGAFALALTNAEVTSYYDLANASYDSVYYDPSTETSSPQAFAFNNDGTKLYMLEIDTAPANLIHQYSLSSAYDLTSMSYDSVSFDISSQTSSGSYLTVDLIFNGDGTKLYVLSLLQRDIFQYSLSSAYDISSASYDSVSFDVASEDTAPQGMCFNSDGTKLYIAGDTNNSIFQYSLSSAYDVSSASYDSVSFSVASQTTSPEQVTFSSDGTKMYIIGGGSTVYQYDLSSAFDISTASYGSVSFSLASQNTDMRGLRFSSDGTKMFALGFSSPLGFYQYTTSVGPALATIAYPASVDWPGGSAPTAPADGETDILVFYTQDGGATWYGFQSSDAADTTAVFVDYLIVAGGGGGGGGTGGGGGAGGLLSGSSFAATSGTPYTITVGSGGAGGSDVNGVGTSGVGSSAFSQTAIGGGGGSSNSDTALSGGSGGGGGSNSLGASGTVGQGNDGGDGKSSGKFGGGGGGGASAAGDDGQNGGTGTGDGGDGQSSAISGSATYYAGGGGGGIFGSTDTPGQGGLGGGGNGGNSASTATSGTANTGGGGGGQGNNSATQAGSGGSGVVILRTLRTAASTTGSPTVTTSGPYNIYTFTGSGSITF